MDDDDEKEVKKLTIAIAEIIQGKRIDRGLSALMTNIYATIQQMDESDKQDAFRQVLHGIDLMIEMEAKL